MKLFILAYNSIINVETEKYSELTFLVFSQFMKKEFDIEIDPKRLNEYFLENKCHNEYQILEKYFLLQKVKVNDFVEIVYKFRIADRNKIFIERGLKDLLKSLSEKQQLILVSSEIEPVLKKELKMFGLTDFFTEIYYINKNNIDTEILDFQKKYNCQIIKSYQELVKQN